MNSQPKASAHWIGAGSLVAGTIRFGGRLVIQGVVEGRIEANPLEGSVLELCSGAEVRGAIEVETAEINGNVIGPVTVSRRLDVLAQGSIQGDVTYSEVNIMPGGVIEGTLIEIDGEPVKLRLQTA